MAGAFCLCGILLLCEQLPHGGLVTWVSSVAHGNAELFFTKYVKCGLCALVVLIWPPLYVLMQEGKIRLALLSFLLLVIGVGLMHSLSAKLGLIASAVVFILVWAAPRWAPLLLAFALPVLFFVTPFVTQWFVHAPYILAHMEQLQRLSSMRVLIWQGLVDSARGHAWLGWGMKSSALIPLSNITLAHMGLSEPPRHPHNAPLQVWLELGNVGLLLVTATLVVVIHRTAEAMQAPIAKAAVLATIAAYLGGGLASFGIWQIWWVTVPWMAPSGAPSRGKDLNLRTPKMADLQSNTIG